MVEYSGFTDLAFSVLGGTIPFFLPLLIATLIGLFAFNWVQKKFKWKWLGSSITTVYILWLVLFLFVHAWNIYSGLQQIDPSIIPDDIRADPLFSATYGVDPLPVLVQAIIQSIVTAGIFALLTMPFIFLGLVTFELIGKRTKSFWIKLIANTWVWCLILVVLFVGFPWILTGLIYLAFFGI